MNNNLIELVPKAVQSAKHLPAINRLTMTSNYLRFVRKDAFSELSTLRTLFVI